MCVGRVGSRWAYRRAALFSCCGKGLQCACPHLNHTHHKPAAVCCVSVCLPVCLSVHLSACLSACLQGVRGYPTIMALSPGSTTWAEYQGDRSAASISTWATSLIGNAAANIKKQADLDAFLSKCGGSSGGGSKAAGGSSGKKEAAAASWGLCVVLASDKSSMPSLWKALSQAFKGKVGFFVCFVCVWGCGACR